MEQVHLLLELQELMQEEKRLKKMNYIKEQVKELKIRHDTINQAEARYVQMKADIARKEKELTGIEEQVNQMVEKKDIKKQHLYGTKGKSMKELMSLQKTVLKMENDIERLENKYLENTKEMDAAEKESKRLKEMIINMKKEYNEGVNDYRRKKEENEYRLAEVIIKKEDISENLDDRMQKMFDDTLKIFPLNPVAVLKKGICSGCNISVSNDLMKKIKTQKGLHRCDNCGRILINP